MALTWWQEAVNNFADLVNQDRPYSSGVTTGMKVVDRKMTVYNTSKDGSVTKKEYQLPLTGNINQYDYKVLSGQAYGPLSPVTNKAINTKPVEVASGANYTAGVKQLTQAVSNYVGGISGSTGQTTTQSNDIGGIAVVGGMVFLILLVIGSVIKIFKR